MKQILLGSRAGMNMEYKTSFKPVIYKSTLDSVVQMLKAGEVFGVEHDKVLTTAITLIVEECANRIINYTGAIGHTLPASLSNDLNAITQKDIWKTYFEFAFKLSPVENSE
jgi:hypothetical protein